MKPDEDLARAFEALRARDAQGVPSFAVADAPHRWRLRRSVATAAAVAVLLIAFFVWPRARAPEPAAEQPIVFDELSSVISREMFIVSASEWRPPTDFLLELDP